MPSFAEAVAGINELKDTGLVADYAVSGAMAVLFWAEAIPTFDLDVLVMLPPTDSLLVSLEPIYAWAAERGYPAEAEHIKIGEVPVQFIPAYNDLASEAVREAKTLDYNGLPIRVARPEHLIGLMLDGSAKTTRRKERAAMLLESAEIDADVLESIIARYNLTW